MNGNSNHKGTNLTYEERRRANKFLLSYMQGTMRESKKELLCLRKKLSLTYWVVISLSITMFVLGVALLSVPLISAWRGDIELLRAVIAAGFGITDLGILFLFRPTQRIHELMGDMSQITLVLNSFQTQVALRLREMNSEDRPSIGRAAEYIATATAVSTQLVQSYFEEPAVTQPGLKTGLHLPSMS